jgi:hypothetical protein
MFGIKKERKIKLTESQLRQSIISAMYFLSDGLEWHVESDPETKHPVVMASPEEIANTVVQYTFWLPSGEDSSATTA